MRALILTALVAAVLGVAGLTFSGSTAHAACREGNVNINIGVSQTTTITDNNSFAFARAAYFSSAYAQSDGNCSSAIANASNGSSATAVTDEPGTTQANAQIGSNAYAENGQASALVGSNAVATENGVGCRGIAYARNRNGQSCMSFDKTAWVGYAFGP